MKPMILSLKNIYKLLMYNDFPIYSESVISKKNKKGQTLQRFWQNMLADDFRCLPYGKMIWRTPGSRNRHISDICNRNEEMKYYREYAKEINAQINTGVLLNQIQHFSDFLRDMEYKQDIFLHRVKEFIRFLDMDTCVTESIKKHIADVLLAEDWSKDKGVQGQLFHSAYLLTVMTLYAAAGDAMNDLEIGNLRDTTNSIDALWYTFRQQRKDRSDTVSFLTTHCGTIQDHPLSPDHFFGREDAFLDLREMATKGSKCLISGIGGVGKTEILRQLIRWCCKEHAVDKLAVIPYQTNFEESLRNAFPSTRHQNYEDAFPYILHQLEAEAQNGRLLLLIDDLTGDADDANLQFLTKLPCAVLITSRRRFLDGFDVYPLNPPSKSAGSLIFRDNYGHPLSEEDRWELLNLLQNDELCLPLTLRLMAKAAAGKKWSVGKLREELIQKGLDLAWAEGPRTVRLGQLYAQLYSLNRIPQSCHELTKLFTLMPFRSYCPAFLLETFPDICVNPTMLADNLKLLTEGGWLDQDGSSYSMHPLIAQCLRPKTVTQTRMGKVLSGLCKRIPQCADFSPHEDENTLFVCQILVYISQFLSGKVSADLMIGIMDSMHEPYPSKQLASQYKDRLQQMFRRCPDKNDIVEIVYHTVLCSWSCDDEDTVEHLFRRQQRQLTVPVSRFMAFCISANNQLSESRPELAEEILQEVLKADVSPQQKASAYRDLLTLSEYRGNSETALYWGKAGVAFVSEHPECGKHYCFNCISGLATMYLKFGQLEDAKPLLDQMDHLQKSIDIPAITFQHLSAKGTYELYRGNFTEAYIAIKEALKILDKYYGKCFQYYATLNQLAIILQRQKRYEEAKTAYEEILSFGKDTVYFNIARNNYAVLLLDIGEPEQAMPYLTQVLAAAREQGGIALGEAQRNMARAHGLLGNYSQEYECLQEAVPLLEEAYGTDHPRAAATRELFAELKKKL